MTGAPRASRPTPAATAPQALVPAPVQALVPALGVALVVTVGALSGCGAGAALPPNTALPAAAATAATTSTRPAASAAAGLVAGFPTELVPLPPGAAVTSSALAPGPGGMQLSLSGTTSLPVKTVLAFYRTALTKAGFTTTKGNVLPSGASGAAYSRNGEEELLIVAVVDNGARRSFSVGGTIRG